MAAKAGGALSEVPLLSLIESTLYANRSSSKLLSFLEMVSRVESHY